MLCLRRKLFLGLDFMYFHSKRDGLVKYFDTVRPTLLFVIKISTSSPPGVFFGKGVLKICSKFTEEHLCRSVISIKLLCKKQQHGGIPEKWDLGPGTLDPEPIHGTQDSGPSTRDSSLGARDP